MREICCWLFCEHCQKIMLPYIPDVGNKIKSVSKYCLNCEKPPTDEYLLRINEQISISTYRKVWFLFNELAELSASMCMSPNFPEIGYNKHIKHVENARKGLF